jgi:O-antigen/teichoic acid export membrane protein
LPKRVLFRRRAATAFGVYGAALLGFLATVVAARELSKEDFARFALVFGTTTLLQTLVDLTIDEVVIKYGNRYAVREDWGRFHQLFRVGMLVKLVGGAAGTLAVVAAAFLAPLIWKTGGLQDALLIASLIPLIQQPEGMAGAVLTLRNRYDLRGWALLWSMALRLAAVWLAAPHGLVPVFVGIVAAQVIATASVSLVAWLGYRRFPRRARVPLGADRPAIRSFAVQSTVASGLASLRTYLPTVLLGIVARAPEVAYFRAAQAPQTAFQTVSAPARLVLLAEQTRDVERGRADRAHMLLRRYIGTATVISLIATPLLWIFMPTFIRWIYRAKYLPATDAFRVMLLVAVVQFVFGWTKSFPVSIGRPGMRTAGQALEVAVLVPGVLVLGALYGATGAAFGMLAGSVVLAAYWTFGLLRLPRPEAAPAA